MSAGPHHVDLGDISSEEETRRRANALHEGHCPSCFTKLRTFTEIEQKAASLWDPAPLGYCPGCDHVIGWSEPGPPVWFAGLHGFHPGNDVLEQLLPPGNERLPWWTLEQNRLYDSLQQHRTRRTES